MAALGLERPCLCHCLLAHTPEIIGRSSHRGKGRALINPKLYQIIIDADGYAKRNVVGLAGINDLLHQPYHFRVGKLSHLTDGSG